MQKLFNFVEGEVKGLHEAAYLLGSFALFSTLLALYRDRLLAATFGAGEMLDIYYAAFRIPDIVFVSIASLVSVFILVPILTQPDSNSDRHTIMGNVMAGFSTLMLIVTTILWFLLPQLLSLLFPDLVSRQNGLLILLSRILLLQPIFLGFSGILASVTQVHGRYLLYAIAPLLYNIGILFGIVGLYPLFGMPGIAYGVVLGALLHMGIQVPFALRVGYLRPADLRLRPRKLWRIISVSIPRTISISANQLALLVLIAMAATLGAGSVSVFSLAFNLQAAPLSIIGASYSVAAFPTLARFFSKGQTRQFCDQIITASRHIIFWSIPLMSLVVVLRAHIVRVILGSGSFDWADTRLTSAALALFIISLTAQALSLLFVRGYYAAGETMKPLLVNVATAVGVVGGGYWLTIVFQQNDVWRFFVEELLRVENIRGTEILMLPLSYAIFSVVNVLIFSILYERDFGVFRRRIGKPLFESFSAAVVAGFFAYQTLDILDNVLDINTFIGVFLLGLFAGVAGIAAGVVLLHVLQNREIKEVWETLHHKIWRYIPIFSGGTERGTDM
ncbi:hypothetical protein CL652_00100 [bacterium]|nr:hypothetical protein [bacterium]|tara:strand:- start:1071 stop:2750 length:1680 start_codon:yes stop_codon:yes gene_type:complete